MKSMHINQVVLGALSGIGALIFILAFFSAAQVYMVLFAILVIVAGFYLSSYIKRQDNALRLIVEKIAAGDFNSIQKNRDKQTLSSTQQLLIDLAESYEKQLLKIITEAHRLSAVYNEMQILIDDFLYKANTMNEASGSIASATEELSTNTIGVSASTEQASKNIDIISSNTEEMTATINEISMNSEKTRSVASRAVISVEQATEKVSELGKNADEISTIIDAIEDISEQTKLLALNATIEAARAGEAGKGFAVVANEVKELAGQTATATENIKTSIYTIQGSTSEASEEIKKINRVIGEVDENISSIATAVEEQNVTTHDISQNITQAAEGMKEVSSNVADSTSAAQLIAKDMVKIRMGSEQILTDGVNINSQIKNISKISGTLDSFGTLYRFTTEREEQIRRIVDFGKLLQARESDHLKWVKKVQNALAEHRRTIDVQKDPTLCGMGKFLNSPQRRELEKINPKIAAIFREIEEPHKKLHQSAARLEEMIQNSESQSSEIENFYNDTTLKSLNEVLHLFHLAINENFNSLTFKR